MKKIYFTLLSVMLFAMTSCESDVIGFEAPFSELEVHVTGTLSGNPRSGLNVFVYETEDDAINEINAITFLQNTDSDGYAFFSDLEPGFRYWVRVDTTLLNNINQTEQLNEGFNEMSMTIL